MPPFEPSAEIQLSGPLCNIQDWREDNGRGQLEGLTESITARKTHWLREKRNLYRCLEIRVHFERGEAVTSLP